MPETKPQNRVSFDTSASQLDAIERWRAKQRPIPSRNESIRRLVDRGLEAEGEPPVPGNPEDQ